MAARSRSFVEGAGIVGSVTVSGLPQRDDHNLVVEALCAMLGRDFAALRLRAGAGINAARATRCANAALGSSLDQRNKKSVGWQAPGNKRSAPSGVRHFCNRSAPPAVRMPLRRATLRSGTRAKSAARSGSLQAQPRSPARFLPAPASRSNKPRVRRAAPRATPHARIARCRSAWRARSSGRSRWRISGLRPSVPVPLHGTSASTRSKADSSSSAAASASRHSTRSRVRGKALAQLRKPLRARFAGHDARLGIALGENQRLAARRRAGVEDTFHSGRHASPAPAASSPTNCDPSS